MKTEFDQYIDMLPEYKAIEWQDLKSITPWMDLDGLRLDIDFAKQHIKETAERKAKEDLQLREWMTRRMARFQIMREWMETFYDGIIKTTIWHDFLQDHPEAKDWFDDDGVPM